MYMSTLQHSKALNIRKRAVLALLLCGVLPFSTLLWSQTPSFGHIQSLGVMQPPMRFEHVLEKVQQHQATLGLWQVQQGIADANIKQSSLWENPSFSVQQTGFESNQERELELGISQKLDLFGERKSLIQLSKLQKQQVELNQRLYEAQLKLIVSYLWSEIAIFEQENQVAILQLENSQAILDAARLRYRAGSIAELDQDRTLMTHIENQRAAAEVTLKLEIAKKRLANLWGETQSNFSLDLKPEQAWPEQNKAQITEYLKQNLRQRSLELQAVKERLNENYLKAKRRPNPTLTLGMVSNKAADTSQTQQQLRVGLDIPLHIFDHKQYALEVSRKEQQFMLRQKDFYTQQNLNHIHTLQAELTGLKKQYSLMYEQQIPLSIAVQHKMLLGFKAGKYAITDVQQSTAELHAQQLKKLELLKSAWQKTISAQSLALGVSPEQVMSNDALNQINQAMWQSTNTFNSQGAE